MQSLILLSLFFLPSTNFADSTAEQAAVDYFFENIYSRDFPEFKTVEFTTMTTGNCHYSAAYNCKNYNDLKKKNDFRIESFNSCLYKCRQKPS
jgi:hypothetical protein